MMQKLPPDFEYPVCLVCGKSTPKKTKKGKRLSHSKRMAAKTCGDIACFSALLARRKPRGTYSKKGQQPKIVSRLDIGFQFFNFDRALIESLMQ
jgi:hypothetical protein